MQNNNLDQKMENALFEDLFVEFDLTARSYSGRGMYGRQCLGVAVDVNMMAVVAGCGARGLPVPIHDQLGKGWILYWPDRSWASWEKKT